MNLGPPARQADTLLLSHSTLQSWLTPLRVCLAQGCYYATWCCWKIRHSKLGIASPERTFNEEQQIGWIGRGKSPQLGGSLSCGGWLDASFAAQGLSRAMYLLPWPGWGEGCPSLGAREVQWGGRGPQVISPLGLFTEALNSPAWLPVQNIHCNSCSLHFMRSSSGM